MESSRTLKFILPSLIEVIVCFVAASAIFLVFHFSGVMQILTIGSAVTPDEVNITYQAQLERLDQYEFLRTLVLVGFWAGVGLVAYVAYLFISQAVTNIRNNLVITTQFTNRGKPAAIIMPILIHALVIAAFGISLWLSYQYGLHFWISMFEDFLYNANWLLGILSLVGLAANIYILWLLFQLVRTR
jgi:hypothetical protein